MFKNIYIILLFTVFVSLSAADTKYFSIRLDFSDSFGMEDFAYYGFDSESAVFKGNTLEFIADSDDLKLLDKLKVKYRILTNDPVNDYQTRIANFQLIKNKIDDLPLENGFTLGSVNGYFSLSEIYQKLDSLKLQYPAYFIETDTIGYSIENRPIISYAIGSSDKQNEILITALHHAREPGGVSVVIYFLYDILLKASEGNKEALYLLNNRTLYFVPVVNPDGYMYNLKTNPNGGGLWRKNRRQINDSTWGVDLNRNYGPYEYWNAPVNGSSVKPSDATFRGSEPFSEPETKAIRDFALQKNIKLVLNYHTYGNLLVYPYSALVKETDDSLFFRDLGLQFSSGNRYLFGLDKETVNYSSRGCSDDWFYWTGGAKNKKVYSFTPEVGKLSDNFWTTPDRILAHCRENLYMNYQFLWSGEVNWVVTKTEVSDNGSDTMFTELKNIGVYKSAYRKPNVQINSLDTNFSIEIKEQMTSDSSAFVTSTISSKKIFSNGYKLKIEYVITEDEVDRRDSATVNLGKPGYIYLFRDEELFGYWNKGNWSEEYNIDRNAFVLSDSPEGFYSNSDSNYLTLADPLTLNFNSAYLQFKSYWEIEPNFDYAIVEISIDSGLTWVKLDAKRMTEGQGIKDAIIKKDETGFTGYSHNWVESTIPLNDYLGKSVLLRFGMLADKGANANGWLIDDLKIKVYYDLTNVSEKDDMQSIFYPNPSELNNNIRVNNYLSSNFRIIDISDLIGTKYDFVFNPSSSELNIINPVAGVYFVRYELDKQVYCCKLILF